MMAAGKSMPRGTDSRNRVGARREPTTREPEMKEQHLFLLEFFVHSISGARLAKLNQMFCVPTSVCFQFLNFNDDSIAVTPVDPMFEPQSGIADEIEYFYSGRSVMFAIAEDVVLNKILDFKVALIVEKKMPDNIKPNVLVGVSSIDLSKEFAQLRVELQQCWRQKVPAPKTCEGEYPLVFNSRYVGDISLYVRMSAFGQTIVTEFDVPPCGEEKQSTFLFKGDEIGEKALTYKCRMIDSGNVDICEESNENLVENCSICVPARYVCKPCESAVGAVGRSMPAATATSFLGIPATYHRTTTENGQLTESGRGTAQPCGKGVVLKVSGLLNAGDGKNGTQRPTVTVVPESEATGPNNPPDPEHDVFILRIGKKGLVSAGEKSDIQLEMRTPKGPERRPPIRYETREMQTEVNKKGGKKKGGKKKGGKKKKGKK